MQQQIEGEVANSITCLWAYNFSVCNSERIIKIGQYLQKLCSNGKGSSFFWLTVYTVILQLHASLQAVSATNLMHSMVWYGIVGFNVPLDTI